MPLFPKRVDGVFAFPEIPSPPELPAIPAPEPPSENPHYLECLKGFRTDSILDGLLGLNPMSGRSGGGWVNHATGLGSFQRDKVMQGHFEAPYLLSWQEITSLNDANDIAQRIIWAKPKEMFRRGWMLVLPEDPTIAPLGVAKSDQQEQGSESGPQAPGAPLTGAPKNTKTGSGPDMTRRDASIDEAVAGGIGTAPPSEGSNKSGVDTLLGGPKDATPQAPGGQPADGNQSAGADKALAIEAYAQRLGVRDKFLESTGWGRALGGGLLIVSCDDGQDVSEPLNEDNIRSIKALTWIDRRFAYAKSWYTELGEKFGQVELWDIINPFGGASNTVIHESRVIRFEGAPVDFLRRRQLLGWTLSVLQAPYDVLRQFDMSFQSVSNLMADISQAVMSLQGLAQMISNDPITLQTRMQLVDMSRSSSRMIFLDAENEKFERVATPLTGVAETLEMQMLRLAAAAEMPVALLFGREPSGLNATGDADFRRFYDMVKGEQVNVLEPKLRRVYELICKAKDGPTGGKLPAQGLQFIWHKLYEPSEKEASEVRWNMAQADEKYVGMGSLLPEEVSLSRFRSGELHLDTEIRRDLRRDKLATAQLPPSGKEKFDADQKSKQQELQIKQQGVAAKAAGKAPAKAAA